VNNHLSEITKKGMENQGLAGFLWPPRLNFYQNQALTAEII
jgi:hypothetical protein